MRKIKHHNPNSIKDIIYRFQKDLINRDISTQTTKSYSYDLKGFFNWFIQLHGENQGIEKANEIDLISYRQYLVNEIKLKPTTINRRMQSIKTFFKWLYKNKAIQSNVTENLRFMKISKRAQPKALEKMEIKALLNQAKESSHGLSKRNCALLQLMLQAGLRVSEVNNLKISDVVIKERSGHVRIRDGKGHKEREVPLNSTARQIVNDYLKVRKIYNPDDYLFQSKRDTQLSIRAIQEIVANIARKARIERIKVSPHTLRHTFAINYLQANQGKLIELSCLLGHESLDTTAIYTRPSNQSLALDLERSPLNIYEG